MAEICTGENYTQLIDRTECIGNSLAKINSNFRSLDLEVCSLGNDLETVTTSVSALSSTIPTVIQSAGVPVGAVMGFFTTVAPPGWLRLNGAANLSRSQYANLWAHALASGNIVTKAQWDAGQYGSFHTGDGSTTFGIPFTEGFFLRGFSFGNTWDGGRVMGSYQADGLAEHTHSFSDYFQSSSGTLVTGNCGGEQNPGCARNGLLTGVSEAGRTTPNTTANNTNSTTDTRPRNVPILYCIKF